MSPPTVIFLGASRGVGFAAFHKLASARREARCVLLLRSVSSFQSSAQYESLDQDIISRTFLVEGDAHSEDNVRDLLWKGRENLDSIVFSIGFTPPSGVREGLKMMISGMKIEPADLCTRGLITLLRVLSEVYGEYKVKPKLVVVSSMGIGLEAHKILPYVLQPLYSHMLQSLHADKLAMEVVMEHSIMNLSCSFPSTRYIPRFFPSRYEPDPAILPPSLYATFPEPFILPSDFIVLRPALLTDTPEKGSYRVAQENKIPEDWHGMYSIGREDVGGFIAELLQGTNESVIKWWGHQVVLAY